MPVELVVTVTWCTLLRSAGTAVLVATYFRPCWAELVVAMPTKLFDGSPVFFHVSKDTAIPSIPENPSPPPLFPKAVGLVSLALARVKVIPSAPDFDDDPMKMSNDAVTPTPGTAVGQKAE